MSGPIDSLLTRAFSDPSAVEAEGLVQLLDASPDHRCELLRAIGNGYRELRSFDDARARHEEALSVAETLGSRPLTGLALMSLAATLTYFAEEQEHAVALIERALPLLDGDERVAAMTQRAGILQRVGRHQEALGAFAEAEVEAARSADASLIGDVWLNRGVLHGMLGDIDAGVADTERALELFRRLGWDKRAADMVHNLAWLAGRRGDVVGALALFEQAEDAYAAAHVPATSIFPDRCEVLLAAGLAGEATAIARRAADRLASLGGGVDSGEAHLLAARAALLAGDLDLASSSAAAARTLLQERAGWPAAAEVIELDVLRRRGEVDERHHERAVALADGARRDGLLAVSVHARLVAAEIASHLARWDVAAADLDELDEGALDLASGLQVGHLRARQAAHGRQIDDALCICDAALERYGRYVDGLGGTEMRAHAAVHVERLAAFALALAVRRGDASEVLQWAERQRGAALDIPPVRPDSDPVLDQACSELRGALVALDSDMRDGVPNPGAVERIAVARERISLRTRQLAGAQRSASEERPDGDEVHGRVEQVVFIEADGRLLAVRVEGDDAELVELGPSEAFESRIRRLTGSLSIHLRAIARGDVRDPVAIVDDAERLDEMLDAALGIGPERADTLMLSPAGPLTGLPWGLLPRLRDSPFVLAPSLATFRRARARRAVGVSRVVAVAGPGLALAADEARAVLDVHEHAFVTALTGHDATVRAVLDELGRTDVMHLACHGRFERDNPMFSSLVLHDGPLSVHEIERVRPCPAIIVLSACHGALHAAPSEREVLGITASLLATGARSVIASTMAVPDTASTVAVMRRLHERLAAGDDAAVALSAARGVDPIVGGVFACHGAP